MLGLHYTFATNFLVSLFDEKLSRREIDPTNFLQRSSRHWPPRCRLDCSQECIENGAAMIERKRGQIQRATEFDSGLSAISGHVTNTLNIQALRSPSGLINAVWPFLGTNQLFQSH